MFKEFKEFVMLLINLSDKPYASLADAKAAGAPRSTTESSSTR